MKKSFLLLLIFHFYFTSGFSQSITIDPTEQSELLIYQKNTGVPTVSGRHKNFGQFQVEPSNANNSLLRIGGQGFSGILGGYSNNVAQINFSPTQTFSSTNQGTKITFHTTANNTTNTTEKMRIDQNGNVGIGINSPDTRLHIQGAENNGTDATLKLTSGSQNMILDGNEIDSNVGLYLNNNSAQKVNIGAGGLYGSGAGNFNMVPIGIVNFRTTISNNGNTISTTATNLVGALVISYNSGTDIGFDDKAYVFLNLDPSIYNEYSKVIAVGSPSYSSPLPGGVEVSGDIGEIYTTVEPGSSGNPYFYCYVMVDDFTNTFSYLGGTFIFYGIK